MLNNLDLFENFFYDVKKCEDMSEILKAYGGSSIYVPSFKNTYRNNEIVDEYLTLLNSGVENSLAIRQIAKKHNLSVNSVYNITKDAREPRLF
ncbi:hypothetical protein CPIN18021_1079 [Campylobacter pinnipediorum subsp. caledonicus]|uniref:Mor transcription activator domain-containing protein n=1 Tax=Campylobacter pinnipediorum subsp. caledonicus TaxID=1874362 RepID=A0A1S6U7Z4_9BACT|nr:hypothetical protein [Campylobacter pinnipediorum]AQW85463.1 hypothetical protein CPIN18020_0216 [Campylobacter pinnipediorum subsp. caledonicus]AQW87878.1 hypothetical protein CPIN18021_1079 [Campylobacter pinnipediorum subsp. caledonicus]